MKQTPSITKTLLTKQLVVLHYLKRDIVNNREIKKIKEQKTEKNVTLVLFFLLSSYAALLLI